ncbi:MAG TPA: CPBP family intramembrane glutamic endopeptidase [Candidatus Eremiobacteraceae bacterium]|nr:CPBP family intramembrane glutamic endopeptidase [Candidatus Eremiobacteraceae bacterium]
MSDSTNSNSIGTAAPHDLQAQPENATVNWRQSKWLVAGEFVVVALIFAADARHFIPLSKTPFLLAFAWISLWVRRIGWRRVGLTPYRNWKVTLGLGVGAGLLLEGFELFVSQPLLVRWLGKQPDLETFRALNGNLKWTLIAIAGAWTLAAFGEEMVYRGYLMNRVADLLNRTRRAWIVSLIAVHVAFGLAHAYQGVTGVIDEGLMGLLLGIIYLRTGRNLSVPIIAHGVSDSIDVMLIFLGKYPGM